MIKKYKCENCEKIFEREPRKARRSKFRYCGKSCAMKHLWKMKTRPQKVDQKKDLREKILKALKKRSMSKAQDIARYLDVSTYEVSSNLKELEKAGSVYKVFHDSIGSWGLLKNFRCYNCGTTKNPSETEKATCRRCVRTEVDFQFIWATKPLTENPPEMPVWIYAG